VADNDDAGAGSPEAERAAIAALVRDVAESGREIADEELRRLRKYLVSWTLDRPLRIVADSETWGYPWPGPDDPPILPADQLDQREAKYLKHVVHRGEWPVGTSIDEYMATLRHVVLDENGGVYLERDADSWKVTFVARTPRRRGARGGDYIIVAFLPEKDRWLTGFRPTEGLTAITRRPSIGGARWLKRPRRTPP